MIATEERIVRETHAFHCLECGKCTANCPVSRVNRSFSPRMILSKLLVGGVESILTNEKLYTCLTCGMCSVRCPSDVRYTELMQMARVDAYAAGHKATLSHGGVLQEIMKIHSAEKMKQDRTSWLGDGLKTSKKGEVLYFAGCQPYFDAVFEDIGAVPTEIGRSAIKLLNALGVKPVVMPNERCCGHDLLWMGDEAGMVELAKHNVEAIRAAGAKLVVTSCAECYRTLAKDYPRHVGELGFEVQHISQYLAGRAEELGRKLKPLKRKVSFQDPCRLGRHMGVYEEPRALLGSIPDLEFADMRRSGQAAVCCGTSAWINCDMYSKQIQVGRLREAKATGAETLVTACPKCYIHFTCATSEKEGKPAVEIEVKDLCVVLAESLEA